MAAVILEPRVLGELLVDPGFENHIANTGGGPGGNEIPLYNKEFGVQGDYHPTDVPPDWCFPALTWSDKTCAPLGGWGQSTFTFLSSAQQRRAWQVSTDSPHSGSAHARLLPFSLAGGGPHWLYPLRAQSCRARKWAYSARVQGGDELTWSAYWRHVDLTSGSIPAITTVITWWDSDYQPVPFTDFFSSSQALTGTYTKYSWTRFAPKHAYYVLVSTRVAMGVPNADCRVDMDTASLVVTGDS